MNAAAPRDVYLALMDTIRRRLDLALSLESAGGDAFARTETAAFHGRKVVEGIAFACLVATEHGLKHVPRDAMGKWNAEEILRSLQKKNLHTFPSPSVIRDASPEEKAASNVKATIKGIPERRLSHEQLIQIYQRMHRWLHEVNPYVSTGRDVFHSAHAAQLWADLKALQNFIERHFISIKGEGFFCALRDQTDGQTKVLSLSKVAD